MEVKFIIIITVALFFIALVQLMKIYDLAAKVRGEKSQEKISRGENMLMANLMLVFMLFFFGFIVWLIIKFGANSGLYTAATEHGREIDDLLMINWWIILPVFFSNKYIAIRLFLEILPQRRKNCTVLSS
jgi:preprotein translocase subunit SecG